MVVQMAAGKAGKQPATEAGLLPEEGSFREDRQRYRERQRTETEQTERRQVRGGSGGEERKEKAWILGEYLELETPPFDIR